MAPVATLFYNNSGVLPLTRDVQAAGSQGWLLSFAPSPDWQGSLLLAQDQNAPGTVAKVPTAMGGPGVPAASALTPVTWTDQANPTFTIQTATPISGAKTVIVGLPVYPLYVIVSWVAGSMTITHTPYNVPPNQTVNFSNIVIDSVPLNYDDNYELVAALLDAGGLSSQ